MSTYRFCFIAAFTNEYRYGQIPERSVYKYIWYSIIRQSYIFDTQIVSDAWQFQFKKEKENLISTSISFCLFLVLIQQGNSFEKAIVT